MLARSLMRDIAAVVVTAQPRTANAVSVALSVLFISCSPRGRTPTSMPFACHAARGGKPLQRNSFLFERSVPRHGTTSSPCRFRQVLPGFYRPLTIRAHLLMHARLWTQRYGRCDGTISGAAQRERHLRLVRLRANASAKRGGGVAYAGRHRRAHCVAGPTGAGGTAPARGQARPPRA